MSCLTMTPLYENLTHYEKEIFWDVKEHFQFYDCEKEEWVCKRTTKYLIKNTLDRISFQNAQIFNINCVDRGIRWNKVRDALYKQLRRQIVTEKVFWG